MGSLGEGSGAGQPPAVGADEMLQPRERWDAQLVLPWAALWDARRSDGGSPVGCSLKAVGNSGFWQNLQENGIGAAVSS